MTTQTAAPAATDTPSSPLAAGLVVSTGLLIAAVCVVGLLLGALVALYALAPVRPDIGPLFAAIPSAAAFVGTVVLAGLHRRTSGKLDVITTQTNGVLRQKIREETTAAVAASVPLAVSAALSARRATDPSSAPAPVIPPAPAPDVSPPAVMGGDA